MLVIKIITGTNTENVIYSFYLSDINSYWPLFLRLGVFCLGSYHSVQAEKGLWVIGFNLSEYVLNSKWFLILKLESQTLKQ